MSVAASVARSLGAGLAGLAGFAAGWWVAFEAMPPQPPSAVLLYAVALAGVFCAVLLFAVLTKATPAECAVGAAGLMLVLVAITVLENGGFPVDDREAWATLITMPPVATMIAGLAGRIGRRLTSTA